MVDLNNPIRVLDKGYVRYIAHYGDSCTILEAARMSTGNETGVDLVKDRATLNYLYRHKHLSPFEFADLMVEVKLPLFVLAQWVRHRTFSFNVFSGRYSEMPFECYLPEVGRMAKQSPTNHQGSGEILDLPVAEDIINDLYEEQDEAYGLYQSYLDGGLVKELARINLPQSMYTKARIKANARNWMQFLELRLAHNAQAEIVQYAEAVYHIFQQIWPDIAELFEEFNRGAVTFSKTEMELIRMWADDALAPFNGIPAGVEKKLGKSRTREFFGKLGID